MADCHPDRPYLAKGLCSSCYRMARRKILLEAMNDEEREALRLKERAYFTAYRRVWRDVNPERSKAYGRQYATKRYNHDPVKHRRRAQAARYGMTPEEVDALRESQGGKCVVCSSSARLQIDHCHTTGEVRAMLCGNCNSALGHAKDDTERLRALISYLERFSRSSNELLQ